MTQQYIPIIPNFVEGSDITPDIFNQLVVNANVANENKQDIISDIETIRSNAYAVPNKQDKLIDSGANQNIKTINGYTLLGQGNIVIQGGGGSTVSYTPTITSGTKLGSLYINGSENKIYAPSLDGYATQQWVESKNYLTEHQSLVGYATQQWVESKNYLTEHQSLSGYATQQWVESKNYLTSGALSGYATQSWVEGKNYLTEHQSLSDYATQQWVESKNYLTSHQDISGKQDVIDDLDTIRSGAALGATALQSYTETDPTVPSWAKADSKPSYKLSELSDYSTDKYNANMDISDPPSGYQINGYWEKHGDFVTVYAQAHMKTGWKDVYYQLPFPFKGDTYDHCGILDFANIFRVNIENQTRLHFNQYVGTEAVLMTYDAILPISITYKYK